MRRGKEPKATMYALLKPLLFALDPTTAHRIAMEALSPVEHIGVVRAALGAALRVSDPRLRVSVMGLEFPSPIGLAAGLDKNGERARAFAALGFGHVELGTITAQAQGPNPPPNLFRLPLDHALVNRLGFPNEGAAAVTARIAKRRASTNVPIGVSIGKSRSVPLDVDKLDAVLDDYLVSFRAAKSVADFVVVNVSSPNTKDLRALQAADVARPLFEALVKEKGSVPLLVKIAPDLEDTAIDALVDEAMRAGLSGVVATNTTIARTGLHTPAATIEAIGAGGLSGRPLLTRALAVVKRVRTRLGGDPASSRGGESRPCVIGVGGIDSTETALAMLRTGADLVQAYTGFIYKGPFMPSAIARGLVRRMDEEGAKSLAELVRGPTPNKTNGAGSHAHA